MRERKTITKTKGEDASEHGNEEEGRRLSRPRTREECRGGPRPCPWVSCRYHLYLEVSPVTGSIKFNHPGLEVGDLPDSCALDLADRGESTLEEIAGRLNLTRERVRQLAVGALDKVGGKIAPDEPLPSTRRGRETDNITVGPVA